MNKQSKGKVFSDLVSDTNTFSSGIVKHWNTFGEVEHQKFLRMHNLQLDQRDRQNINVGKLTAVQRSMSNVKSVNPNIQKFGKGQRTGTKRMGKLFGK